MEVNLEFSNTYCAEDDYYRVQQFDPTTIILVAFSLIFMFGMSFFQQIIGFRGDYIGIFVKWWYSFLYIFMCAVLTIFGAIWQSKTREVLIFMLMPVCLISCFFMQSELISLLKLRFLQKSVFYSLRIQDALLIASSIGIIIGYWKSDQSCEVSDLMSLCIIGSMLKIFKFNNMKDATIFLMLCMLSDIILGVIIHYTCEQVSYDNILISNFNTPLELQAPSFTDQLFKTCNWIPITGIIFPGMFINYMKRVDNSELRNRNSYVFQMLSFLGFSIGSGTYITQSVFNRHAWPFSIFSQALMVLFTLIFAHKRDELKLIWFGEFYPRELMEIIIKRELKDQVYNEITSKKKGYKESREWENRVFGGLSIREGQDRIFLFNSQTIQKNQSEVSSRLEDLQVEYFDKEEIEIDIQGDSLPSLYLSPFQNQLRVNNHLDQTENEKYSDEEQKMQI